MKTLKNKKGITLTELMAVVVIIGIVSAMAVPRFSTTVSRLKFRSAARNMVSKLRLARSHAITNKQQCGVYVDGDEKTLTLFLDTNNPAGFSYDSGSDSILAVDTLPNGFIHLSTDFGSPSIVYFPNGSASSTGNVWFLSYTEDDNVNFGSIEVLAATGRTKMGPLHYY